MSRYFINIFAVTGVLLITLFAFYIALFSQSLDEAKLESQREIYKAVSYIEKYFQREIYTIQINLIDEDSGVTPQTLRDRWLKEFSEVSDIQEILLADSNGLVYSSTDEKVPSGSWILGEKRDSSGVDNALQNRVPVWSEYTDDSGNIHTVSYHPLTLDGENHVLVIVPGQKLLNLSASFKKNVTIALAALGVVFIVMFILLMVINKKAVKAEQHYIEQQKKAFLGRTSAELAHELKNPLTIIQSSAEALKRNPDSPRGQNLLSFIIEEALRMSRLINNILSFNRDKPFILEPIHPSVLLRNYVEALVEKNSEIQIDIIMDEEVTLMASRDSFIQITDNLVQNAIKALDGKGAVQISGELDGDRYVLRYKDSGEGVPEAVLSSLFDPFVSGAPNGSGLGLAIVKDICERLGWGIEYSRDEKEHIFKTCFTITANITEE